MIESLESRMLLSHSAALVGVGFYNADGSAATLNPYRDVWLIIHGMQSSQNDTAFQLTAQAVGMQSPDKQVLIVGWGPLASGNNGAQIAKNAVNVGHWVAKQLRYAGITGSRVNLIGFSMGGEVESTIAADMHKINRLIAVDPAGVGNFKSHSAYSIAFRGVMNPTFSLTAQDSVQLTGLPANDSSLAHVETFANFLMMMQRDAGVQSDPTDHISELFSIQNILTGDMPAWKKKSFKGFNAKLQVRPVGADFEYQPVDLTYVNVAGIQVDVT